MPTSAQSAESSPVSFGQLLAPLLADLPPDVLPAFLARLERTAAARYRQWSRDVPAWASELLACADAEDEIADRISAAFPITDERAAALDERLPAARAIYFSAFDGMAVRDQLRLQAAAERQGAHAWRSVASRASGLHDDVHAVLAACSALEERSADVVDALLDRPWPQPSGSVMEAVITHEADRPLEGWTTPTGGCLTWRTLLSGDRDGSFALSAGVTELPPSPDAVTMHRHRPDEVYFIVSGSGSVVIDGAEHPVTAGSTVFIPGHSWHGVRNPGPAPIRMFYVFPNASFADVAYEYPLGSAAPAWEPIDT